MRHRTFFIDFATPVVAGALLVALIVAAVALGPTAYERWF